MRMKCSVVCAVVMVLCSGAFAAVRYVDGGLASGGHTGLDWENAYSNLQTAIDASTPSATDLWIAEGTYSPGSAVGDSFSMASGVDLYGGFTNGMATFGERDWSAHETILDGGDVNTHVVTCGQPIIFDGLVVQNGRDETTSGGAGWRGGSSPTIRNSTFRNNLRPATSEAYGAGIYQIGGSAWIENCLFTGNTNLQTGSFKGGGAMCLDGGTPTITNCTFIANHSAKGGGAIYGNTSTLVVDCTFRNNTSGFYGGAIGNYKGAPAWTVKSSTFIGNTAAVAGGAICSQGSGTHEIDNCVFVGNSSSDSAGAVSFVAHDNGGGYVMTATIRNSLFADNTASQAGTVNMGIDTHGGTGRVENCEFHANDSQYGTLYWSSYGAGSVENCLLVGNRGRSRGAICATFGGETSIDKCTVYSNGGSAGGGLWSDNQAGLVLNNSIVWGNDGDTGKDNIGNYIAGPVIKYTAIEGGMAGIGGTAAMTDGGGIVTNDPQFALNLESGNWDLDGSYDAVSGKTTLTDTDKSWTAGAFTGMTISPDKNNTHYREKLMQYPICTNDATTITTWGDCTWLGTNGAPYQVNSWHLKSQEGRLTPLGWTKDAVHSPCIDAGDGSAYALETAPNGGQVNIGAYGNTAQASRSIPVGTLVMVR